MATRATADALVSIQQAAAQCRCQFPIVLHQMKCNALRRARTDSGQTSQRVDQGIKAGPKAGG
jgi:hypothetical protein